MIDETVTTKEDFTLAPKPTHPDCRSLRPVQMPTCFNFKCPKDYVMIKEPTGEECTNYKCTEPKCCKNVCSSYDCPSGFHPVNDADTTVCNRDKCRRAQCCVLGERFST